MQTLWVHLLEEVAERTWPLVDPRAGLGSFEAPHLLPCPWNVCSVHRSHSGSCLQGRSLEWAVWGWDHLGCARDCTQLSPLYKGLHSGEHVWRSTGLADAQDKPCMWVPFLIKLATCQSGRAASFFCLSLSSAWGSAHRPTPLSFCPRDSNSVVSQILI